MESITGINESSLDELCMKILDYSDELSELFTKISNSISLLPEYYKSSSCEEIMKAYQSFSKNYSVVKSNIISYSDELVNLKKHMHEADDYLSRMFTSFTEEKKSHAKELLK